MRVGARRPTGHPAGAIAKRHEAAVEAWLADELAKRGVTEAKLRARQVRLLLKGTVALMLIHNDCAYVQAAAEAAKALLSFSRLAGEGGPAIARSYGRVG